MNTIKSYFLIFSILLLNFTNLLSQGAAGDNAKYETRYIVDMPTAGILPDKNYAISAFVYPIGGLMLAADFSVYEYVNLGVSFSGNNLVGDGTIKWQNLPAINAKIRAFDERKSTPAFVFGFSSQGASNYLGDNRFKTYSPGFYLAMSKNFVWDAGNLAFHGGANYSLEPKSENQTPNFYLGLEQSMGKFLALNLEFNFQLDEAVNQLYSKRGLLNGSLRGSIASGVTAEIRFRDLLNHARYSDGPERIIALEIIKVLK